MFYNLFFPTLIIDHRHPFVSLLLSVCSWGCILTLLDAKHELCHWALPQPQFNTFLQQHLVGTAPSLWALTWYSFGSISAHSFSLGTISQSCRVKKHVEGLERWLKWLGALAATAEDLDSSQAFTRWLTTVCRSYSMGSDTCTHTHISTCRHGHLHPI